MKPDKNMCLNCGNQISSRAKFCSDKCRKAYARKPDKNLPKVGQNDPIKPDKPNSDTKLGQVKEDPELRARLTKCDKTFYDRAIIDFKEPYYNFTGELRKLKCGYCEKPFETNLSLNRYCSYQHYSDSTERLQR